MTNNNSSPRCSRLCWRDFANHHDEEQKTPKTPAAPRGKRSRTSSPCPS
jgi:hypothetical protein